MNCVELSGEMQMKGNGGRGVGQVRTLSCASGSSSWPQDVCSCAIRSKVTWKSGAVSLKGGREGAWEKGRKGRNSAQPRARVWACSQREKKVN